MHKHCSVNLRVYAVA